jgi:competence protein ComEA
VQTATAVVLALSLVVIAFRSLPYLRSTLSPSESPKTGCVAYQIDLNTADRAELLQLPGVGESLAQRILEYRREHGPFRRVEDLRRIRGIGPVTLEKLRPLLCVGDVDEPWQKEETPRRSSRLVAAAESRTDRTPREPNSKKITKDDAPLDLNQATAEELQRLPGIGPKLSAAIVAVREKQPFAGIEELRRVKGIGAKTLEKLRPFVTIEKPTGLARSEE